MYIRYVGFSVINVRARVAGMLLVSVQVHPRLYDGDAPTEDALQSEGLPKDADPEAEGQP